MSRLRHDQSLYFGHDIHISDLLKEDHLVHGPEETLGGAAATVAAQVAVKDELDGQPHHDARPDQRPQWDGDGGRQEQRQYISRVVWSETVTEIAIHLGGVIMTVCTRQKRTSLSSVLEVSHLSSHGYVTTAAKCCTALACGYTSYTLLLFSQGTLIVKPSGTRWSFKVEFSSGSGVVEAALTTFHRCSVSLPLLAASAGLLSRERE